MSIDRSLPSEPAAHADLVLRAQFVMTITGRETAWVRKVSGPDPSTAEVHLSLDQLTLRGSLGAVRERVAAMLDLLDDVASSPERWPDLVWTHDGETGRRSRVRPHPFVRRPTAGS